MAFRNDTPGARAIHLLSGRHVLVEPGETADIPRHRVKRLAPGLVEIDPEVPPVPKEIVAKAKRAGKGPDDINALRAEYKAKLGKSPFNGWNAATLKEKIAAA